MNNLTGSRMVPIWVTILFIAAMLIYSQISRSTNSPSSFQRDFHSTFPEMAFEAIYTQETPQGEGVAVLDSNGKGQTRLEINSPTSKGQSVTIFDFNKKKRFFINEKQKTFLEADLTPMGMGPFDEEMFKCSQAQSLGRQNINGRPCRGYRTKLPIDDSLQIESWFDARTGALMISKEKNSTLTLTRFIPREPKPSLFQVPANFKTSSIKLFG